MPDSEAVKAFREALADVEIDVMSTATLGHAAYLHGPFVLAELDAAKVELDEWRRLTPMRDELDALRSELDMPWREYDATVRAERRDLYKRRHESSRGAPPEAAS